VHAAERARQVGVSNVKAPQCTLLVGVTADLSRRVWEHRNRVGSVFVRWYGVVRLVRYARHAIIKAAIRREEAVRARLRARKARSVPLASPQQADLDPTLL